MPPASSTNRSTWVIPLRSDLADRILEAGSAGDWAELNAVGRALADAYELARMHDIDADRDHAMRVTVGPAHRDPRQTDDPYSDEPDDAKDAS